jgi:hypothetical protein
VTEAKIKYFGELNDILSKIIAKPDVLVEVGGARIFWLFQTFSGVHSAVYT